MVRLASVLVALSACTFRPAALPLGGGDGGSEDGAVVDGATFDRNPLAPDGPRTPDAHPIDARRRADATPPDAAPADAAPTLCVVGLPCPSTACTGLSGAFCLDTANANWPSKGYCTKSCVTDMDCGTGAFCTNSLAGNKLCIRDCTAGSTCPTSDMLCGQYLYGIYDMGRPGCTPGNPTAQDGQSCSTFGDCNLDSLCYGGAFDWPGGFCAGQGCTINTSTTCPNGDAYCFDNGAGFGQCLDTCTRPSDCRTGWSCIPTSGTTPSICYWVHQGPGTACNLDTDCGPAPWQCLKTVGPQGYCGHAPCAGNGDCPGGAICQDTDGVAGSGDEFCAAVCNLTNAPCTSPYKCQQSSQTQFTVCLK